MKPILLAARGSVKLEKSELDCSLWFLVFLVVLQQLENNLVYPRVVGKSVGLPGIWVLAAVTIGGGAFGILGMLLGVPTCAVIYTLGREFVSRRTQGMTDI